MKKRKAKNTWALHGDEQKRGGKGKEVCTKPPGFKAPARRGPGEPPCSPAGCAGALASWPPGLYGHRSRHLPRGRRLPPSFASVRARVFEKNQSRHPAYLVCLSFLGCNKPLRPQFPRL